MKILLGWVKITIVKALGYVQPGSLGPWVKKISSAMITIIFECTASHAPVNPAAIYPRKGDET